MLFRSPLENSADSLTRAAARFERAYHKAMAGNMDKERLQQVNARLRATERKLTSNDGLPLRPWYRHLLYAPGYYTGYGVKTLPGMREAMEQKDWVAAEREMARIAAALTAAAQYINGTAELLEQP